MATLPSISSESNIQETLKDLFLNFSNEDLQSLKGSFSLSDLKSTYRDLSFMSHPDKGGSNEEMSRINDVYKILRQTFDEIKNIGSSVPTSLNDLVDISKKEQQEQQTKGKIQERKEDKNIKLTQSTIERHSELNARIQELKDQIKGDEKDNTIKSKETGEDPIAVKAAPYLKTGNIFKDLFSTGMNIAKSELFDMTDFDIGGLKLEDYFSPLKNIRNILDVRTEGEKARDEKETLENEVEELNELTKNEYLTNEQRDKIIQVYEEKSSLLEEMQLNRLDQLVQFQEELIQSGERQESQRKADRKEDIRLQQERDIAQRKAELEAGNVKDLLPEPQTKQISGLLEAPKKQKGEEGGGLKDLLDLFGDGGKDGKGGFLKNLSKKGGGLLTKAAAPLKTAGAALAKVGAAKLAIGAGAAAVTAASTYAVYKATQEGLGFLGAKKEEKQLEAQSKEAEQQRGQKLKSSPMAEYFVNTKNKEGKVSPMRLDKYLAANPGTLTRLTKIGAVQVKDGKPFVNDDMAKDLGIFKGKEEASQSKSFALFSSRLTTRTEQFAQKEKLIKDIKSSMKDDKEYAEYLLDIGSSDGTLSPEEVKKLTSDINGNSVSQQVKSQQPTKMPEVSNVLQKVEEQKKVSEQNKADQPSLNQNVIQNTKQGDSSVVNINQSSDKISAPPLEQQGVW